MTIDEKIKLLESRITETDKLLAEIKKEKENEGKKNTESVLAEYWNCLNKNTLYFLNTNNGIRSGFAVSDYNDNHTNDFANYPSEKFAFMAQKIKIFNDMLLAFKWCYDRDYEPEWGKWTDEKKYYIYYDTCYEQYDYDSYRTFKNNVVSFSSAEIAQKCCDWLNEKLAHGELEEE